MVIQAKLMCDIVFQLRLAEVIEEFRKFTQRNHLQCLPNRWQVRLSVLAEVFMDIPLLRTPHFFLDSVEICLESSLVVLLQFS